MNYPISNEKAANSRFCNASKSRIMFKTPEPEKRGRNVDSCSKNITCYLDTHDSLFYYLPGRKKKKHYNTYFIIFLLKIYRTLKKKKGSSDLTFAV